MEETRADRRQSRRKKRKVRRSKRKISASQTMAKILRSTLGPWLFRAFKPVTENLEQILALKPPYLVLANHMCVWDPFIVNILIPDSIHYVVSDANFRSKLMGYGLGLVGSIPKTKAMSDLQTVKNIMKVKEAGGIVGIFPEGQSSWDGHSLPLYYSTAKLAKLLKVPVVTAKLSGAFLSLPRWARHRRHGRVRVTWNVALTPEELRTTSAEEIDAKIVSMLYHDEYEFNRVEQIKFTGKALAEYAEIALFACPGCEALNTLKSTGDNLGCSECGYEVRYDEYGFFQPVSGDVKFDNMHDWHVWQTQLLKKRLNEYVLVKDPEPLFTEDVKVEIGYRSNPLEAYRTGKLQFFPNHISILADGHEPEVLRLDDVVGINVQNHERLEFYQGEDLFRITADDPRACILKWDIAVRYLQSRQEQDESGSL